MKYRLPLFSEVPEFRGWLGSRVVSVLDSSAEGLLSARPAVRLPSQPLRQLLPILLLGEQRRNGCEQFA